MIDKWWKIIYFTGRCMNRILVFVVDKQLSQLTPEVSFSLASSFGMLTNLINLWELLFLGTFWKVRNGYIFAMSPLHPSLIRNWDQGLSPHPRVAFCLTSQLVQLILHVNNQQMDPSTKPICKFRFWWILHRSWSNGWNWSNYPQP